MSTSAALMMMAVGALAGNPLVPHVGMADPNLHFFNGSWHIFATHDFSVNNTGFLMKDWWTWGSTDLVNWDLLSVVKPEVSVPWSTAGERDECWATDAAFRNNKWYFYLSVGPGEVGVVVADDIHGPWRDPLGYPLLNDTLGKSLKPGATFRDPCVFEDDDGEFYIISGVFNYYIMKLSEDMVSIAETPKHVIVNNPYGACGDGVTDDKPFIHKNDGWYGPYDMAGSAIDTSKIDPAFRMNVSESLKWTWTPPPYMHLVPPKAGDTLELYECDNATAAKWIARPSWTAKSFSLALDSDPTLCITADGEGKALALARCDNSSAAQLFSVNASPAKPDDGVDIQSPACPCWNVQDNNARARKGKGPGNGAHVQCYSCVDGTDFNPNQRFTLDSTSGMIRAWDGYAKGACVAVNYPGNPLPPAPAPSPPAPRPWYMAEDYTDRHGSFTTNKGQWYYASNDRSHSGDPKPAFFRDTVVCYIHFRANGTMEPCVINAMGVGEYSASNIEAEEFSALEGRGRKVDLGPLGDVSSRHGYAVSLSSGASIHFTLVHDVPSHPTAVLRVARGAMGSCGVTITGKKAASGDVAVLGSCTVPSTGGWSRFVDIKCTLRPGVFSDGEIAVHAISGGQGDQELVRIDSFQLVE